MPPGSVPTVSLLAGGCARQATLSLQLELFAQQLSFKIFKCLAILLGHAIWSMTIFLSGPGSAIKNHSLVAAVLSVLSLLGFGWWFGISVVPIVGYLVLALIATLSVPIIYRLAGFASADEVLWLENREAAEYSELTARLAASAVELGKLDIQDGVNQVQQLGDLIDDYHSVVETRFLGKKHMPLEYLGAARQVQRQAVQNLSDVVTIGHSMSTIDSNAVDSIRKTVPGSEDHDSHQMRLKKNAGMYTEQKRRMDLLLNENREMFDALTETAVEVANINSFSQYERIDTLARLVSLAEIAGHSGR